MAGDNDRIHGYNQAFYGLNTDFALNNHSFGMENNRPTAFNNMQVLGAQVLDHQGHIIPQNMLNRVLDPVANAMAACETLEEVVAFINDQQIEFPWLNTVLAYGNARGIPMFDFEEEGQEKMDGFFSIITWNPINISRAPSDNDRGGYPGNEIDLQVRDRLAELPQVNADWLGHLDQVIQNPDQQNLNNYITSCSNSLNLAPDIVERYYRFEWVEQDGVLVPANE